MKNLKNTKLTRTCIAAAAVLAASAMFTGCGSQKQTSAVPEIVEAITANELEKRAGKKTFDSYDEIISLLQGDEAYAMVNIMGYDGQVLLVAESVFDNWDGNMAAVEATPYTIKADGKVTADSQLVAGGSATPLAIDDRGLVYCASHKTMAKMCYGVNGDMDQDLMNYEYVYIDEFDDAGNVTKVGGFISTDNQIINTPGTEIASDDIEAFDKMLEDYANAKVIGFTTLGEKTAGDAESAVNITGSYIREFEEEYEGSKVAVTEKVVLKDDHTCEVDFQDTIAGEWTDTVIRLNDGSEMEYTVEGDELQLNHDGQWVTFTRESGDVIPESDYAVFDNDVFTFQYDTKYFVTMEDEEAVTVSFSNEDTQTAGSNTITFKMIEGADAMEVAKEFAKQYGAAEDSIQETNLAMGDVKAYAVIAPSDDKSESGDRTRATSYAVINGDNVITIEVFTHVEPDEGMDMFINDKIAEVLDTFAMH